MEVILDIFHNIINIVAWIVLIMIPCSTSTYLASKYAQSINLQNGKRELRFREKLILGLIGFSVGLFFSGIYFLIKVISGM